MLACYINLDGTYALSRARTYAPSRARTYAPCRARTYAPSLSRAHVQYFNIYSNTCCSRPQYHNTNTC